MNLVIDRELFVRVMFNLERQFHHDERCQRAFSVILPHADITGYDNRHIEDQLVELLQRAFDDEGQSSWIWYFIYELDFGRKALEPMAWREDRTPINLSSAGALYDWLIERMK